MKVKLTFTDEVLGTSSNNRDIHDEFIASKAPDAMSRKEEVEALGVEEVVEKTMTVFPRTKDNQPFMWDYQVRGFFKDTCSALRKATDSKSKKLTAHKKAIDGNVFIVERVIPFEDYGYIGDCQRPLRASTAQGERIALAHSETVQAGSWVEFTIMINNFDLCKYVEEWLDYGFCRGLLQWRNSGKGAFIWEKIEDWREVDSSEIIKIREDSKLYLG